MSIWIAFAVNNNACMRGWGTWHCDRSEWRFALILGDKEKFQLLLGLQFFDIYLGDFKKFCLIILDVLFSF